MSIADDSGRVIVVTGAGKGLGAAFAKAWAARGARVVVSNRVRGGQPSSADAVVATIRASGGTAIADYSDTTDSGAAQAIIAAALEAYGRIDALILNAGISGPVGKIPELADATIRAVMETNFHANTALVQAALPPLLAAPAGRMLFVSSAAGLHGLKGRAAYAASKAALNGYALSLADELKRTAVCVNILCPYAATPMTAAEGAAADPLMAPANAAPMAVYLTSAACRRTGEIWMAGAKRFRRARTVEGIGDSDPDPTPEWIGQRIESLANMAHAREFTGAQAAFIDLFTDAKETA